MTQHGLTGAGRLIRLNSLAGKPALVTGVGRGIGRAVASELAAAGVSVALVSRSYDELTETARLVRELGGTASVIQADLGDPVRLGRIVSTVGSVDILVNNAAVV